MKLFTAILLCMGLFIQFCFAQLNNQVFEEKQAISAEKADKLYFDIKNLSYVRNNEYVNEIVLGETFFGYQFSPTLVYYAGARLRIEAGIFFQKDFGKDDFSLVSPVLSLRYQKDSTSLIFGNLQGNLAHRLIEPFYGFEKTITRHLENGIQILHQKKKYGLDFWIDWQRLTFKNSPFQEEIFGGFNFYWNPIVNEHFKVQIPLQSTLFHKGGQDLSVFIPLTNLLNAATGLNIHTYMPARSFVKSLKAENYFIFSHTFLSGTEDITQNGRAYFGNISLDTRWLELMLSFWQGEEFNSIMGGDLYKSFKVRENGGSNQRYRSLLFIRLMRDFKLTDDLHFTLRFEPFYDFSYRKLEHALAFYINYRPSFFLKKMNAVKNP